MTDEWNKDELGRFGPGNKGGPGWTKGKPRLSLKSALTRAVSESMREEDGRSVLDALAATAIKAAAAGDFRFWKEIIDRFDGPIRQQIEQDQTITIERLSRKLMTDEQEK
tara:strand:+ start:672 stop:1001 length:330 start_codon:yes stop_codon:yes gene_type:complete